MCVVAIAFKAHPKWQLIVAGNRDEYHARPSAPLSVWNDGSAIIGGRDMVSGGAWMGVSPTGRFAVVTNIRDADGPDAQKRSRGVLVADWLQYGALPDDLDRFNPFSLFVSDRDNAMLVSNRPTPMSLSLVEGIHGLSNAVANEHWPRKDRLVNALASWGAESPDHPERLLDLLGDEEPRDRGAYPVFIRSPIYGTRCSTIVAIDRKGQGRITERRFDSDGGAVGETCIEFSWPI
jgi:uncharacterized protein with NRDE domain